jgi:hypothetical protein
MSRKMRKLCLTGWRTEGCGLEEFATHNARLSSIPGYSHYDFGTAPERGVNIEKFLDEPMAKPQGGEAATASKVSQ